MRATLCKITAALACAVLVAAAAAPPVFAAPSAKMGSIAAGQNYSLFVDASGDLYTFGRNFSYTRDSADGPNYPTPTKLMGGVKAVSAGSSHYVILKKDGSVWTAGHGTHGELGDGRNSSANNTSSDTSFHTTKVFENAVAVSAGNDHTLVLDKNGDVWATGRNAFGQLGDGTTTDRAKFAKVKGLSGVKAISAGSSHNLAVTQNGDAYVWGSSAYGALGDGQGVQVELLPHIESFDVLRRQALTPQLIMKGVRGISAGGDCSFMIDTGGVLWACGYNLNKRLGDGTTKSTPTLIRIMDNVRDIDAGSGVTLAIKTDGTVWGWGLNNRGQVGAGSSSDNIDVPVKVADKGAAVSVGWNHSVLLREDGSLHTAGDNSIGQLGNGKLREIPYQNSFKKIK